MGQFNWAEEKGELTAAALDRGWPDQGCASVLRGPAARREISLPWTLRYSNPKLHLFNRDI